MCYTNTINQKELKKLKNKVIEVYERELKYGQDKELYHLNCAEVLLIAANEKYKLDLDNKTLKAIAPFGGGIGCEKICGALSGSVAAIGVLFTEDKPTTNTVMKEKRKKLVQAFEDAFGSIECAYIKKHHRDEVFGCKFVEIKAGEILQEIIEDNN